MSANKIETATIEDADWSFTEDPRIMRCVEKAAIKAASEFELVEFADAQQDALLWVGIHPEVIGQYDLGTGDGRGLFTYRIYSDALRERAIRADKRGGKVISYERAFGEGEEA